MRGKFRRFFSCLLAAAMVISMMPDNVCVLTAEAAEAAEMAEVTETVFTDGFEEGLDNWTAVSGNAAEVTYALDKSSKNSGTYSLNLWIKTAENSIDAYRTVDLQEGTYTISYYMAGKMPITWYVKDANDNVLVNDTMSDTCNSDWAVYTEYTHTFTIDAAYEGAKIGWTLTGTADAWGRLDDISLTRTKEVSYTLEDLQTLLESVPEDLSDYKLSNQKAVAELVKAANALIAEESEDTEAVEAAYVDLEYALSNLVLDEEVFIRKVQGISEGTIRGIDISSYESIMKTFEASGGSFKDWDGNVIDRQGFFNLLKDAGVNYVRIRVWNDPFTAEKKGYGGGNNDVESAKIMGQYATKAGMKVLIDFHYSDFWADPGKQKEPKAWAGYTEAQKAEAIHDYTKTSIQTLLDAGVDVGMVQVGNETTNKICGVNRASANALFDAGCDAVHEAAAENDKDILAAIHFTNPERASNYAGFAKNLANYDGDGDGVNEGVSYDVFASSYYPYWHGTLDNLTSVLRNVAKTYDKYVMVAETSWAYTLADGDGHDNTVRQGQNSSGQSYAFSVQGQADEVRAVFEAGADVDTKLSNGDDAFIGLFYWEGAWIPVTNVNDVFGKLKEDSETVIQNNKTLWEEYGSGWASSHAAEYDAEDAGQWFGGSAVDNQAFFDFDGYPLDSLNVFKYVIGGSDNLSSNITSLTNPADTLYVVGDSLTVPKTVVAQYEDGTTEKLAVTWDAEKLAKVQNGEVGEYDITGTVEGTGLTATWKVTVEALTITLLANPPATTVTEGGNIAVPGTVKATYNNGSTGDVPVTWDAGELMAAVGGTEKKTYTVTGGVKNTDKTVSWDITVESGDQIGEETLNKNGDFETVANTGSNNTEMEDWTFKKGANSGSTFLMVRYKDKLKTHGGNYALMCGVNNGPSKPSNCEGTAYQTISDLDAGIYQYSAYLMDVNETGYEAELYAYTYSGTDDGTVTHENAPYKKELALTGSYAQYKLGGIQVKDGETLVVGIYYKNESSGYYVTVDDCELKKVVAPSTYEGSNVINVAIPEKAALEVKADAEITVPDDVTIDNAGTIENDGAFVIAGTVKNTGSINSGEDASITVEKSGTLNIVGAAAIVNGDIQNSGKVSGVVNGKVTGDGEYDALVAVTGVNLDRTSLSMEIGDTETLVATVVPDNAAYKDVTWESSNESVATVSGNGQVTAVAAGTATVTVTTVNGGKTADCEVTVTEKQPEQPDKPENPEQPKPPVKPQQPEKPKEVKVTGIQITGVSKKIAAGKKITLTAQVVPQNASNQEVIWTSSNPKYATVDSKGVVATKKTGAGKSVTITAAAKDGSGTVATYKITLMKDVVKSISLKADKKTVKAGSKVKIKATVKTSGKKANKTLVWTSSNPEYATVNSKGVVSTKKAGKGKKVKITATTTDGSNKKKSVTIKLK